MDKGESIFTISHMNVHCIKLCLYACTPNLTVKLCAFLTSELCDGDKLVPHFETALPLLGKSPGRLESHTLKLLYPSWEMAPVI